MMTDKVSNGLFAYFCYVTRSGWQDSWLATIIGTAIGIATAIANSG